MTILTWSVGVALGKHTTLILMSRSTVTPGIPVVDELSPPLFFPCHSEMPPTSARRNKELRAEICGFIY